jgi:hypothetical protein|nr:MAG TPA: hypothetical protein [Caudoviricetes sp.]
MWKHKNFINLQLCAGPIPFPIVVNGTDVYIQRLSDSGETGEETWSYNASINTDIYSISGNTVVWSDGTILQYNSIDVLPTDNIIVDGEYTTRTASTLKFKHLTDAGTIGSGTVKFRHYSQQGLSTGETWVLNSTITAPSSSIDKNIDFLCVGTSQNFIRILIESEGRGVHLEYFAQGDSSTAGTVVSTGGTAVATEYRTLTFDSPVTDTALLTWLQANGTKQGGGGASN